MFIYRVKRNGEIHDYSKEYDTIEEAKAWYADNGLFCQGINNRKLMLYKNSKKIK